MIASDDLKLNQSIKLVEDFLIELSTILRNDSSTNRFEPEILFNSSKFINLLASILEVILKRNNLKLKFWENLIK